jgi:hypothetical protein
MQNIKTGDADTNEPCENEGKKIAQVFDRSFKRLMAVSSPSIVLFINGIFGTDYPLDTPVSQLSTEYITDSLEKFFADILFLVGNDKYAIEAQMTDDKEMALRIFNYGYLDAIKNRAVEDDGVIKVRLPQCIVIYLEPSNSTPSELTVELEFADKTLHRLAVPTIRFLDYSISELEERNMTLLLPFYLLKLRKQVKAAEESGKLKELSPMVAELVEDISKAIARSEQRGCISGADARAILEMMGKLYNNIYGEYPDFKETSMMINDMMLTYSEEAALKAVLRNSMEIAQKLMRKGWTSEEIAETVNLDVSTVESLYKGKAQGAMHV